MVVEAQTKGACLYCGGSYAARSVGAHLKKCAERSSAVSKANRGRRKPRQLYHVRVHSPDAGHWLHLEVQGNATLADLDHYLRAIWLECCGHLSGFKTKRSFYTQAFEDEEQLEGEESIDVAVDAVFEPGLRMGYEYDFGSTTALVVDVVAQREGRPTTAKPVALMARNGYQPPKCANCGADASWVCVLSDSDGYESNLFVCEAHRAEHEDEADYPPMPLFNSPRTGVCAYDGPAEPPY